VRDGLEEIAASAVDLREGDEGAAEIVAATMTKPAASDEGRVDRVAPSCARR
jgi:hypothetical protein